VRGHILLEGGAEFHGAMARPDRRAIELAGGADAPVGIIPTAAAPDNNHRRAGGNGIRWFRRLGATHVTLVPLVDRPSADDPALAAAVRPLRLIYLLGGFPHYLGQTLAGSRCWEAMLEAYRGGAVLGGSSAGAMVLCQHYYDPDAGRIADGLNLIPRACIIPHHNRFGQGWAAQLVAMLPTDVIIGIDEQTGLLDDRADGRWTVYGKGAVTLYAAGQARTLPAGETLLLQG
jgi:cyanophycinase